ncbi:MAG: hypothetical protein HFP77_09290 [Methylococcales symbiont of Iophon sp. n. MRB-2018]|nr:MAG: hypothetical protein HFP77_09290 [Methylococcales symbiont of Iophon sp. n. MRB-2018]KAF3978922.1 MAG: hypothetical protein HFP76_10335 [Methylococcales symbiont of Iophon sp. n. MRB-2018]
MKKLAKPLIVSALLIVSVGVCAQGYSGYKVKKIISTMDDNADSKVNYKEFIEQTVTDNKDPLDTNRDGYITAGEIVIEITEDLIETIKEMRKQGVSEADINKTIAKELSTAEKEAEAMISKMDSDNDNLVEPEEFDAFNRKQFNSLDKNQDGVISQRDINRKKGYPIHLY